MNASVEVANLLNYIHTDTNILLGNLVLDTKYLTRSWKVYDAN